MKKVFALIVFGCILVLASSALATTMSFSTTGFKTLEHGRDYTWQTDSGTWGIPDGEYIVSASLKIFGLNNSEEPETTDYLNIYLLNNPYTNWPTKELLTVYRDENGYYTYRTETYWDWGTWSWKTRQVKSGYTNPSETLSYDLSTDQITDLTSYLSDKIFGIGLDPNCHYSDTKITFTIVTDKIPVQTPEPASLLLFGLGLLGVAGFRKRMKK